MNVLFVLFELVARIALIPDDADDVNTSFVSSKVAFLLGFILAFFAVVPNIAKIIFLLLVGLLRTPRNRNSR